MLFKNHNDKLCEVYHVQVLFVVLNSAVNPLAYALSKKDIKKELKNWPAVCSYNSENLAVTQNEMSATPLEAEFSKRSNVASWLILW